MVSPREHTFDISYTFHHHKLLFTPIDSCIPVLHMRVSKVHERRDHVCLVQQHC